MQLNSASFLFVTSFGMCMCKNWKMFLLKFLFLFVHFITDLIYTPKILWKAVHDVPCKSATIPVDYVTTAECNQVFCFETFCSLKGLCKCVSGLFFIH